MYVLGCRMAKQELISYQLMEECLSATSVAVIKGIIEDCIAYKGKSYSCLCMHGSYVYTCIYIIEHTKHFTYDANKQLKLKLAAEKKQREEGKRREFEARMIRKAKREGRTGDDLNYYLKIGLACPTTVEVQDLKCSDKYTREQALAVWRLNHSQHCFSYHYDGA